MTTEALTREVKRMSDMVLAGLLDSPLPPVRQLAYRECSYRAEQYALDQELRELTGTAG